MDKGRNTTNNQHKLACDRVYHPAKSIDNYIEALTPDGIPLHDYDSEREIGLNLHRFGGFYWKFIVNQNWTILKNGESISFTLVGANWLASTSDVFNNWVFTCKDVSKCNDGPQVSAPSGYF